MALNIFLDCLFDAEYSGLVIEGNPSEDQIKDAWHKIYVEYIELVNDGSYNEIFELSKEVQFLSAKVVLVDCIVKHLGTTFDAEMVKMLRSIGIPCDLKADEDPSQKLKMVVAYAKKWLVTLELKEIELKKTQGEKTGEQGRYGFYEALSAIGRHDGHTITEQDITVIQFVRTMKKMEQEYLKQMTLQNHK